MDKIKINIKDASKIRAYNIENGLITENKSPFNINLELPVYFMPEFKGILNATITYSGIYGKQRKYYNKKWKYVKVACNVTYSNSAKKILFDLYS